MQFVVVLCGTLCFLQKLLYGSELYSINICQFDSKNGGQSALHCYARAKCCFVLLHHTWKPFLLLHLNEAVQRKLSNFEQSLKHELSLNRFHYRQITLNILHSVVPFDFLTDSFSATQASSKTVWGISLKCRSWYTRNSSCNSIRSFELSFSLNYYHKK